MNKQRRAINPLLPYLALALLCLLVFVFSIRQLSQPDPFYHLKTGQFIWQTKSVPHFDLFSYSAPGAPWVTHEWLSQVVFYGIYAAAGFWGVILFAAALAALAYGLLMWRAHRRGASPMVLTIVVLAAGLLTFQLWTVRPQVFGYLALVILLLLLESYRQSPRPLYIWLSVAVIFLWANLHASFILGIGLLILYAICESVKLRWPKLFGTSLLEKRHIFHLFAAAAAACAAALANPNGYKVFFYGFAIRPVIQALHFFEWQPITSYRGDLDIKVILGEIVIVAALSVWWFGIRRRSRDLTFLAIVVLASVLPFFSVRHNGLWSLLVFLPLAAIVSAIIPVRATRSSASQFIVFAIIAVLIIYGVSIRPRLYFDRFYIPVYAADFVERNNLRGPLFNLVNEGGYLIWRLWPQEKVFIDSRAEVYPGKPLEELSAVINDKPDWHSIVDDKYHINYFIFSYHSQLEGKAARALMEVLMKNNWVLVYWDDAAVVFVRNSPGNQALIDEYGMKHISPLRDPATIGRSEYPAALRELDTLAGTAPESQLVRLYRQSLMRSLR